MSTPWHPQPGKRCLECDEEELKYKYFGDGRAHCMYCGACKSAWYGPTEEDVKRQYKGGNEE